MLAWEPGAARAVGESVNGFPNWAERVIHQWINRARVDPQLEMNACGSPCVERECYSVMPPLSWSEALNRAARFHSDELVRQGYFAHNSACTVVSNINGLYPASCNGSAACACVGGTRACSPTCTSWSQRVQLFGASPSGEIIASPSNPNQAFYLWLFEPGDTTSCQFTSANGHRWLILKSTGAVGAGVAGYSTGEFGAGAAPAKIPSGTHYPLQAATVEAWANWYDSAGPTTASVNVDGVCSSMALRRGTPTNGAWSATVSGVGSGCHRYYFSFSDAAGATVTYPTTGSLAIGNGAACPEWDSSRPAACAGSPVPSHTASASATATRTRTPSATPSPTPTRTVATPTSTRTPTVALSGDDISGYVRYYSNDLPVPGIGVHDGDTTSATTDDSGHYALANVPAQNVLVYPEAVGLTGDAISALDAARVLQFIAGLRSLSAQQALACDVTGDGSLSALDATRILQYTVGLIARFPAAIGCESDWVFIPTPAPAPLQTLIQPQPGPERCAPGGIAYDALDGSLDEQNFSALVFGDCTGNWQPPVAGSAVGAAASMRQSLQAGDLRPLRRGRLTLPIAIDSPGPVHAIDLRIVYDPDALRVVRARLVGRARHALLAFNADDPGVLRMAIASGAAISPDGRPIVLIAFEGNARRAAVPSVSVRLHSE